MSCTHRENTVAWCHGEATDEAGCVAHLAACAECRQTVSELEAVWASVAGHMSPPIARSSGRRWAWVAVAGLSIAAATVLALRPPEVVEPTRAPTASMEPVDAELVDLELALDALDSDLLDL